MKKVIISASNYASNPDRNWRGQSNKSDEDITDLILTDKNEKIKEKIASMAELYGNGSSRDVSIIGFDDENEEPIEYNVLGDNLGYYQDEAEDNINEEGGYIESAFELTKEDYSGQIAEAISQAREFLKK